MGKSRFVNHPLRHGGRGVQLSRIGRAGRWRAVAASRPSWALSGHGQTTASGHGELRLGRNTSSEPSRLNEHRNVRTEWPGTPAHALCSCRGGARHRLDGASTAAKRSDRAPVRWSFDSREEE